MDRNPDKLAIAIALLLGDSKEKFTYERQLRMFQFQCWLLDTHKQDVSFGTSAIRFGGAVLSSATSRMRSTRLRTRDCLLLAIARRTWRRLSIAVSRRWTYTPLRLSVSSFKKGHDDARTIIEKLNTVLEVRLQLHAAGQSASLANTWKMLPKLTKGIGAETTLKPLRMARRQRQPFLYAAQRVAPEFLTMNFEKAVGPYKFITAEGLLSQMAAKVKNRDAFRSLCGAAKAIAEVIEDDVQWSEETVAPCPTSKLNCPRWTPFPPSFCLRKSRAAPRPKQGRRFATGSEHSDPGRRISLFARSHGALPRRPLQQGGHHERLRPRRRFAGRFHPRPSDAPGDDEREATGDMPPASAEDRSARNHGGQDSLGSAIDKEPSRALSTQAARRPARSAPGPGRCSLKRP